MKLACGSHGEKEWRGEIMCSRCGRLFKKTSMAPVTCACGSRLLPEAIPDKMIEALSTIYAGTPETLERETAAGRISFTARICCSDCFKIHYPRVRMA